MTKKEWEDLFEKKKQEMDQIGKFIQEIEQVRWTAKTAEDAIQSENWYLAWIKENLEESKKLLWEIEKAHTNICEDTEEEDSYETLISWIYKDFEAKQKQQALYFKKLFWETITKENGETEQVKWLEQKIDDFFSTRKSKIDALLKEAEEKLGWASTSVELATVFSTKVWEYKISWERWSNWFIGLMLLMILYYILALYETKDNNELLHVWIFLLYRLPLIGFWIWLIGFIWNRRAEAKKLEEAYKHKEVMARTYVWYRKSVEELDTEDNKLLETHMGNLLKAISDDSSKFLRIEWEKHPLFALFWSYGNKDGKSS
jgi:hypothetical protein